MSTQSGLLGNALAASGLAASGLATAAEDCSEKGGYGMRCKDRRRSNGSCCCTSWTMKTQGQCEGELEALRHACVTEEEFERRRTELKDTCCFHDDVWEEAKQLSRAPQKTAAECNMLSRNVTAACGDDREALRGQFNEQCCLSAGEEAKQRVADAAPGSLIPCDEQGGTGTGTGDGTDGNGDARGGDIDQTDSRCGNSGKTNWKDLIGKGLSIVGCAAFRQTCGQGGEQKSIYCGDFYGAPGTVGPGPDGELPPDWVPDWFPEGFTGSQYAQIAALTGLGVLGVGLLLWALLSGGDDEDEEQQGANITINLPATPSGGQPSGGQPSGGQPSGGQPSGGQPSGGQQENTKPAKQAKTS